jgi:hypothetical protein
LKYIYEYYFQIVLLELRVTLKSPVSFSDVNPIMTVVTTSGVSGTRAPVNLSADLRPVLSEPLV